MKKTSRAPARKLRLIALAGLAMAGAVACSSSTKKDATGSGPGAELIRSDFKGGELGRLCTQAIQSAQTRIDAVAQTAPSARTPENTFLAFENALADLNEAVQPLGFMKYVSPSPAINAEGAKCEKDTGEFLVKALGRRDLYDAIRSQKGRDADERRLLKKTVEAFEENGLKLSDQKLAQMTALMTQLNELQNQFSENLNNDASSIEATAEELEGATPDFVARLKRSADGSKLVVTTKKSDYTPLMENVKSSDVRKRMAVAYNNRQGEANTRLLEQAIQVRYQIARLMGFKNWADYQLHNGRMAKDSGTVLKFLGGLRAKLAASNRKDIAQLLKFKQSYEPSAKAVAAWDVAYLANQLRKRDFAVDNEKVREYFPSESVIRAIFETYSQLLGVRFEQVREAGAWSPDVQLYKIVDAKSGELVAHFFTDFIPRQGKYSHFAAFNLINGRRLPASLGGGYRKPVSAIVGNFNPPSGDKPSLLDHDEVVTVFHEFGHIMHQTLTTAPYASLSGSSTSRDFVEAPSQMLENWAWEGKILERLSGHYSDPSKKLPPELLKSMLALRDYQQGYFNTRQLVLGLTDMNFHTATGPVDTAATYDRIYKDLLGVDPVSGTRFPAGWGHLMGGYDAGYYGYLWSLVYAEDMFTAFRSAGLLDPGVGLRYRRIILERGNMEDADVLLTRFLKRPSNNRAFFRRLKIN